MEEFFADGPILILGEGNFSFSVSLIKKLRNLSLLVCTCLESHSSLSSQALQNVQILSQSGIPVYFEIDATNLTNQQQFHSRCFSNLVFNFPHAGGKNNIKLNRELLRKFFVSAEQILEIGGKIFVTLCQGQGGIEMDSVSREWNNSWQIVSMANFANLILNEVLPFNSNNYPEYIPSGYRSENKSFCTFGALTYIFVKSSPPQLLPNRSDLFCPISVNNVEIACPAYFTQYLKGIAFESRENAAAEIGRQLTKKLRLHWDYMEMLASTVSLTKSLPNRNEKMIPIKELNFGDDSNDTDVEFHSFEFQSRTSLVESNAINEVEEISTNFEKATEMALCKNSSFDSLKRKIYNMLNNGNDITHSNSVLIQFDLSYKNVISHDLPAVDYKLFAICWNDIETVLKKLKKIFEEIFMDITCELGMEKEKDFSNCLRCRLKLSRKIKTTDNNSISHIKSETETEESDVHNERQLCCCSASQKLCKARLASKHLVESVDIGDIFTMTYEKNTYTVLVLNIVQIARIYCQFLDWRMAIGPAQTSICQVHGLLSRCRSLFPPVYVHDVSFWLSDIFNEGRFLFFIRNTVGDIVREVTLLDRYVEPSTGKISHCYRITYQSHDYPLSKPQCNAIQLELVKILEINLQVILR